mmetsp:Transcript_25748/g.102778  ORF Transcript_25748/g.102778 Transcript_25748/m.102778 type:complete len:292 (+) Transcript_25748:2012-2887(+)
MTSLRSTSNLVCPRMPPCVTAWRHSSRSTCIGGAIMPMRSSRFSYTTSPSSMARSVCHKSRKSLPSVVRLRTSTMLMCVWSEAEYCVREGMRLTNSWISVIDASLLDRNVSYEPRTALARSPKYAPSRSMLRSRLSPKSGSLEFNVTATSFVFSACFFCSSADSDGAESSAAAEEGTPLGGPLAKPCAQTPRFSGGSPNGSRYPSGLGYFFAVALPSPLTTSSGSLTPAFRIGPMSSSTRPSYVNGVTSGETKSHSRSMKTTVSTCDSRGQSSSGIGGGSAEPKILCVTGA